MIRKLVFIIVFIQLSNQLLAQSNPVVLLRADTLISLVKQFHPLVKQGGLLVDKAEANLLQAKGAFDPLFSVTSGSKTFDDKKYYSYTEGDVKIPLPVGNLVTGIDDNSGLFLNPEITRGRSSYLGVEVPLLRGLLTDKRRTALKQAREFVNQSEQEKIQLINMTLLSAYAAYWDWAASYKVKQLYDRFVKVSAERLKLVKLAFRQGDRSAMDTTEAFVQWQSFLAMEAASRSAYNEASFELSGFLWMENDSSYLLPENWLPDTMAISQIQLPPSLDAYLQSMLSEAPPLKIYDSKLDQLKEAKKLAFQGLLPDLNMKANMLSKNTFVLNNNLNGFIPGNNRWGVSLSIPMFAREARGKYKEVNLKIRELSLERAQKKVQLSNKIRAYYNEAFLLHEQITLTERSLQQFQSLLRNEELRFNQGESSLFVINSRENKLLETAEKLVKLQAKFQQVKYILEAVSGRIR